MDRPPVHELSAVNGHCLRFKYSATSTVAKNDSARTWTITNPTQISVPGMLEVWKRGRPSSRTNPVLSGSISCEGAQRASGCAPAWDSTFIRSVSCTFETFVDSAAKRTARFCNLRTESVPGQSSETRSHQLYGPSPIRGFVPFDVDPL